jgi:hypothetical protein
MIIFHSQFFIQQLSVGAGHEKIQSDNSFVENGMSFASLMDISYRLVQMKHIERMTRHGTMIHKQNRG